MNQCETENDCREVVVGDRWVMVMLSGAGRWALNSEKRGFQF